MAKTPGSNAGRAKSKKSQLGGKSSGKAGDNAFGRTKTEVKDRLKKATAGGLRGGFAPKGAK